MTGMLLDLKQIRGNQEHIERRYEPSAFDTKDELYSVAAPVLLRFDITKDEDQYRLVGRVSAELRLSCSRCLEGFSLFVDEPFDLRYLPHTENRADDEEVEIEEDDLDTAFYTGETIDLGQLMREQFYLTVPMKPLCDAGCKGLCPECGTNLNSSSCDCQPVWEDPRLAPLKGLLDKKADS